MMAPPIILVAASGLAREVLAVLRASGNSEVLLVDDDRALHGTSIGGAVVIGGVDAVSDHPGHAVLVCAGRGPSRRSLVRRLAGLGVSEDRYARVIHPSVDVPDDCEVGPGTIVLAQTALTTRVRVGRHVVVMPNVTLTHDDVVEDFATLCAGVTLGGSVRVGSGAYLGMNSAARERVTIGNDAVLGMGAALVTDLPAGQVWAGVPATPLTGLIQEVS